MMMIMVVVVAITAKMVSYSYAIVKVHIMYLLKSDNEFDLEVNISAVCKRLVP